MFGDTVEQSSPAPFIEEQREQEHPKNLMTLTKCEPESNTEDERPMSKNSKKRF